eukprot:8536945-Ditylum_brightwellii.AAC.1
MDKSASANNSSSSSTSISQELTDAIGHMEVVITLVQAVTLQPKVINLMPPFKKRWEAVQPTAPAGYLPHLSALTNRRRKIIFKVHTYSGRVRA